MKGKRFTEEQIIRVLKEAESGLKVSDLCRQQDISEATYWVYGRPCQKSADASTKEGSRGRDEKSGSQRTDGL